MISMHTTPVSNSVTLAVHCRTVLDGNLPKALQCILWRVLFFQLKYLSRFGQSECKEITTWFDWSVVSTRMVGPYGMQCDRIAFLS